MILYVAVLVEVFLKKDFTETERQEIRKQIGVIVKCCV